MIIDCRDGFTAKFVIESAIITKKQFCQGIIVLIVATKIPSVGLYPSTQLAGLA